MLGVIAFEREPGAFAALRQAVEREATRVLVVTGDLNEALRFLAAEVGAVLAICSLSPTLDEGATLAEQVLKRNRDSYVLLVVDALDVLEDTLGGQMKVCGVIVKPIDPERARRMIRRVLEDYQSLGGGSDDCLVLKVGGSVARLSYGSIRYVEACGKKLDVWTGRQCLSVYESLASMEQTLGARFIRCHRSYLVNRAAIAAVDFAGLALTLTDGRTLPLSRSQKHRFRDWLGREEVKAYG